MKDRLDRNKLKAGDALQTLERFMTQEKINTYVSAAEDYNPIHVDPEFAKTTAFKRTIVPGYQFLAYISEMMTRDFGEKWITGGVMDVRLLRPVFPGDNLTIGGRFTEKLHKEIRCEVWIKNQKDEEVVVGHTTVVC